MLCFYLLTFIWRISVYKSAKQLLDVTDINIDINIAKIDRTKVVETKVGGTKVNNIKAFKSLPKKGLVAMLLTLFSFYFLVGSSAYAQSANSSQKAMKLAESQTKGKAVNTKFVDKDGKQGYKVRILKDGKVSHVYISLQQIN